MKFNNFNCGVPILLASSAPSTSQPIHLLVYPLQLDLFPDVQEAYVAELIQKNNVKDLNV